MVLYLFHPLLKLLQNLLLVTVKAEVMHVCGVKKTPTLCQRVLSKQEVTIPDPTSSVKVILWGSWVNSLQSNKTYLLQNLRVKTNKNERYLNTAKDEKFLFQEVEPKKYHWQR